MDPDSEGWQLPRGGVPADSPPKAGTAVAGEGLERLEALHQVVEERPAQCQLGLVALPQNLRPAIRPSLGAPLCTVPSFLSTKDRCSDGGRINRGEKREQNAAETEPRR